MADGFDLNQHNVVAFVATRDSERARVFYRDLLGLRLASDQLPFALVFDAHGIMLRVTPVRELTPSAHTILGWEVSEIEEAVSALTEKGVKFERFPGMTQDELGIWAAPGGAKIAWFHDPDGNTLSLSQH